MLDKPRQDWTLDEARDRLDALVEAALAGVPQVVTRDEDASVVIVPKAEYDRLTRPRSFKEHLLSFPQGGEDELDFEVDRRLFRMRDVEF